MKNAWSYWYQRINLNWREKKPQKWLKKKSKIIAQQAKTIENPNIVDIRSAIIKHPKTSHKLSKSIKQAKKVSQVSGAGKDFERTLYSEASKSGNVLNEKV